MYTQAIVCLINQACNNILVEILSLIFGLDLSVFIGKFDNLIIFSLL
ncbi:MAG: hypothetical protein Q8S84_05015 [bacterium]|nr:hypothetical protein [bacterium]MDP3380856.1 hypothetical protein [bacterium]